MFSQQDFHLRPQQRFSVDSRQLFSENNFTNYDQDQSQQEEEELKVSQCSKEQATYREELVDAMRKAQQKYLVLESRQRRKTDLSQSVAEPEDLHEEVRSFFKFGKRASKVFQLLDGGKRAALYFTIADSEFQVWKTPQRMHKVHVFAIEEATDIAIQQRGAIEDWHKPCLSKPWRLNVTFTKNNRFEVYHSDQTFLAQLVGELKSTISTIKKVKALAVLKNTTTINNLMKDFNDFQCRKRWCRSKIGDWALQLSEVAKMDFHNSQKTLNEMLLSVCPEPFFVMKQKKESLTFFDAFKFLQKSKTLKKAIGRNEKVMLTSTEINNGLQLLAKCIKQRKYQKGRFKKQNDFRSAVECQYKSANFNNSKNSCQLQDCSIKLDSKHLTIFSKNPSQVKADYHRSIIIPLDQVNLICRSNPSSRVKNENYNVSQSETDMNEDEEEEEIEIYGLFEKNQINQNDHQQTMDNALAEQFFNTPMRTLRQTGYTIKVPTIWLQPDFVRKYNNQISLMIEVKQFEGEVTDTANYFSVRSKQVPLSISQERWCALANSKQTQEIPMNVQLEIESISDDPNDPNQRIQISIIYVHQIHTVPIVARDLLNSDPEDEFRMLKNKDSYPSILLDKLDKPTQVKTIFLTQQKQAHSETAQLQYEIQSSKKKRNGAGGDYKGFEYKLGPRLLIGMFVIYTPLLEQQECIYCQVLSLKVERDKNTKINKYYVLLKNPETNEQIKPNDQTESSDDYVGLKHVKLIEKYGVSIYDMKKIPQSLHDHKFSWTCNIKTKDRNLVQQIQYAIQLNHVAQSKERLFNPTDNSDSQKIQITPSGNLSLFLHEIRLREKCLPQETKTIFLKVTVVRTRQGKEFEEFVHISDQQSPINEANRVIVKWDTPLPLHLDEFRKEEKSDVIRFEYYAITDLLNKTKQLIAKGETQANEYLDCSEQIKERTININDLVKDKQGKLLRGEQVVGTLSFCSVFEPDAETDIQLIDQDVAQGSDFLKDPKNFMRDQKLKTQVFTDKFGFEIPFSSSLNFKEQNNTKPIAEFTQLYKDIALRRKDPTRPVYSPWTDKQLQMFEYNKIMRKGRAFKLFRDSVWARLLKSNRKKLKDLFEFDVPSSDETDCLSAIVEKVFARVREIFESYQKPQFSFNPFAIFFKSEKDQRDTQIIDLYKEIYHQLSIRGIKNKYRTITWSNLAKQALKQSESVKKIEKENKHIRSVFDYLYVQAGKKDCFAFAQLDEDLASYQLPSNFLAHLGQKERETKMFEFLSQIRDVMRALILLVSEIKSEEKAFTWSKGTLDIILRLFTLVKKDKSLNKTPYNKTNEELQYEDIVEEVFWIAAGLFFQQNEQIEEEEEKEEKEKEVKPQRNVGIKTLLTSSDIDSHFRKEMVLFKVAVEQELPQLAKHFKQMSLPLELLAYEDMSSLYTNYFDSEIVIRIWDQIFLAISAPYNTEKEQLLHIITPAVLILKELEKDFLESQTFSQAKKIWQKGSSQFIDPLVFQSKYFDLCQSIIKESSSIFSLGNSKNLVEACTQKLEKDKSKFQDSLNLTTKFVGLLQPYKCEDLLNAINENKGEKSKPRIQQVSFFIQEFQFDNFKVKEQDKLKIVFSCGLYDPNAHRFMFSQSQKVQCSDFRKLQSLQFSEESPDGFLVTVYDEEGNTIAVTKLCNFDLKRNQQKYILPLLSHDQYNPSTGSVTLCIYTDNVKEQNGRLQKRQLSASEFFEKVVGQLYSNNRCLAYPESDIKSVFNEQFKGKDEEKARIEVFMTLILNARDSLNEKMNLMFRISQMFQIEDFVKAFYEKFYYQVDEFSVKSLAGFIFRGEVNRITKVVFCDGQEYITDSQINNIIDLTDVLLPEIVEEVRKTDEFGYYGGFSLNQHIKDPKIKEQLIQLCADGQSKPYLLIQYTNMDENFFQKIELSFQPNDAGAEIQFSQPSYPFPNNPSLTALAPKDYQQMKRLLNTIQFSPLKQYLPNHGQYFSQLPFYSDLIRSQSLLLPFNREQSDLKVFLPQVYVFVITNDYQFRFHFHNDKIKEGLVCKEENEVIQFEMQTVKTSTVLYELKKRISDALILAKKELTKKAYPKMLERERNRILKALTDTTLKEIYSDCRWFQHKSEELQDLPEFTTFSKFPVGTINSNLVLRLIPLEAQKPQQDQFQSYALYQHQNGLKEWRPCRIICFEKPEKKKILYSVEFSHFQDHVFTGLKEDQIVFSADFMFNHKPDFML